jgi:hypothetical protein
MIGWAAPPVRCYPAETISDALFVGLQGRLKKPRIQELFGFYATEADLPANFRHVHVLRHSAAMCSMRVKTSTSRVIISGTVDSVDDDLRSDQRRATEPQDAPPREITRIPDPLVASSLASFFPHSSLIPTATACVCRGGPPALLFLAGSLSSESPRVGLSLSRFSSPQLAVTLKLQGAICSNARNHGALP